MTTNLENILDRPIVLSEDGGQAAEDDPITLKRLIDDARGRGSFLFITAPAFKQLVADVTKEQGISDIQAFHDVWLEIDIEIGEMEDTPDQEREHLSQILWDELKERFKFSSDVRRAWRASMGEISGTFLQIPDESQLNQVLPEDQMKLLK